MNTEQPLVSIIVPAYNTEEHFTACIESVLAQTYSNWELILVNDGSADATAVICDHYALIDPRVVIIHRENGGVGAARNAGLDHAKGEFIAFLDADDVLPRDSLEIRVALMDDADLALARYGEFVTPPAEQVAGNEEAWYLPETTEPGMIIFEMPFPTATSMDRRDTVLAIVCSGELRYQGYTVNKLFRASIINANHIRFDADLRYNEDRLFCAAYALHVDTTNMARGETYWYRRAADTAMGALTEITDAKTDAILTEFDAYDRLMALVEPEYPEFVHFLAADGFYRAVNLKKTVPASATRLRKALEGRIASFGRVALAAPGDMFGSKMRLAMRAHMLLKR